MSPARPRVVVVGGGVIGCAVAWRLALREADVVLLERDAPGAHASSAAAGMLSPLKEAREPGPFLDMGLRSLERYPAFVEALESSTGLHVSYRRDGRLDVALDADAASELRTQRELQEAAGFDSRLLEPAEVRRLEPGVHPDVVLGLATEHDHQVDNRALMDALWSAVAREGVDVRQGVRAAAIRTDDRRATGVVLEDGDAVDADTTVVAAGAWSGRLHGPRRLPVRPVRGQIVVLRTVPPALRRTTWGPGAYLVPRLDGRLLVGATTEEEGFRAETTAGAVAGLLAAATRLVPGLANAPLAGFQVGLRPATPDDRPILGPDPEVDGLIYATGHFRNGILLAPETAERVAAMALDGEPAEAAFAPDRFDAQGETAGD